MSTDSTSTPLTRHRRPLPALTGVRFLAAFYVVLFHGLPWLQQKIAIPRVIRAFLANGYLAVDLFFILSGFILAYTYHGQIAGRSNRMRFWEARIARIYPVYFLSLILALPFEPGLSLTTKAAVLAMVQAWNPLRPAFAGAWNYPAWSLSVEMFFYLCFPALLSWISKRRDRSLLWVMAFLALACVILRSPIQGLGILDRTSLLVKYIPLPALRLPEFLLGMAVGLKLLRDEEGGDLRGSAARLYLALLTSLAVLCFAQGAWLSVVAVPFAVIIYELAAGDSLLAKVLSTRLMVLLGSASYAVYLLQFPVRSWTRVLFTAVLKNWTSLGAPLTPLILVLFSVLVFYVWEEPWRKGLRRYFGRAGMSGSSVSSAAAPKSTI